MVSIVHRGTVALALFIVALTGLTVATLLLVVAEGSEEPQRVTLAGVNMEDLGGFVFTAPGDEKALITAEEAKEIAADGYEVREVVLAHLKDEGSLTDSLVWLINNDPLTVPPVPADADYNLYYISVVDARTGELVFNQGSADICSRAHLFPEYKAVTDPICSGAVRFD